MSGAAGLQLIVLLVLLAISTPLLGSYMAKVYGGGKAPGRSLLPPGRALDLPQSAASTREREQRWTTYAISLLAFSFASGRDPVRAAAAPGPPAVQPRPPEGRRLDALVQHRGRAS